MSPAPPRAGGRPAAALALAVGIAVGVSPFARADHIRTLDADLAEDVLAIEGDGDLVRTANRTLPVASVKEILFPAAEREARPAAARLFLATGDELAGEVVAGNDARVSLRTASLGQVDVGLDLVRAVALTGDEADLRRFRKEVLPLDPKQDVAIMRSWAQQEGTLDHIDPKGVVLDTAALGTVTLGPDKAVGARLKQLGKGPSAPPGLRARLDLVDGSVVSGKLRSLKAGIFTLDAAFKPGLELKAGEVRSLSFLGGKIVYLSDLEPAEVDEHAKVISIVFKHREDANVMGNPLKVDGRTFRKGLGVHAYTRLVYRLDGGFSRFRSIIGLDDEARERRDVVGTVRFQVLVDGKPALGEHGMALGTRDPARPVDVDLTGATSMALIADFGESQDTLARGAWGDAYLVKK